MKFLARILAALTTVPSSFAGRTLATTRSRGYIQIPNHYGSYK